MLDREGHLRDRALFDLGIDSKLRGCDLVRLSIGDVVAGVHIRTRAIVVQKKTGRPVQFELNADFRASLLAWPERRGGSVADYVFRSRTDHTTHMSTRQYARLIDEWVTAIGLRRAEYATHSLRRTKAAMIWGATRNLYPAAADCGGAQVSNKRLKRLFSAVSSPSPIIRLSGEGAGGGDQHACSLACAGVAGGIGDGARRITSWGDSK